MDLLHRGLSRNNNIRRNPGRYPLPGRYCIIYENVKFLYYGVLHSGGPDGEIGASMRYLSQRFTMPNRMAMAVLNDIGTEELAHLEMVSTIVHQLTKDLSMEEIEKSGFGPYYIDHTVGVWPQAAGGVPFNACEFQSKGDPITDLFEDLAADGATT